MRAFLALATIALRLNGRNWMALVYGYIFPLLFLLSFWVIYRHDQVPLALHVGALLTVTALGGACFGLPTTLVSERERGVWRNYRLTPVGTATLIAGAIAARTVLLLSAAVLQIGLALALGMPVPPHPLGLFAAFLCTCVAFLSLGMLIAGIANSVPTVQALGQCIFLPMLIIGGVAVPLESLPAWAARLSAFFPGRFAVEGMQSFVTGDGWDAAVRPMLVLLIMGGAASLAAIGAFQWDAQQRPDPARRWRWYAAALVLWGGTVAWSLAAPAARPTAAQQVQLPQPGEFIIDQPSATFTKEQEPDAPLPLPTPVKAPVEPDEAPANPEPLPAPQPSPAETWQAVTPADFAQIAFDRLPDDNGLITPFANRAEEPDEIIAAQLEAVRANLDVWEPGKTDDLTQRTRNYLYAAAVVDVLQMEQLERFLPGIVFDRLRAEIPRDDLVKVLYWVAMHPQDGDDTATRQLGQLGLPEVSGPTRTVRSRVMIYAFKMLGRLTGDVRPVPVAAPPG